MAAVPSFTTEVLQNFDAWDIDHDGVLSPQELDAVVSDPHVTGEGAAAAATLKMMVRSGKFLIPPMTRDYFAAYSAYAAAHARPPVFGASSKEDSMTVAANDSGLASDASRSPSSAYPGYQLAYRAAVRRIRATDSAVFVGDAPSLTAVKQGHIGDCFFLAAIGGLLHRNSADVRKMIAANDDGSYDVEFPSGKKAHIAAITDGDVALGSGSTGTGRWVSILEAAYGALRSGDLPRLGEAGADTDSIAKGGSLRLAMRTLTGHAIDRIALRMPGVMEMPDESAVAANLPTIRDAVALAMKDNRLIGATTTDAERPAGITPRHAYALIGFDANADTITLWNPHGQSFTPRGESGLKNGYSTRGGVFTVPVIEFARIFSGLDRETDQTATTVPAASTFAPGESIFVKRLRRPN